MRPSAKLLAMAGMLAAIENPMMGESNYSMRSSGEFTSKSKTPLTKMQRKRRARAKVAHESRRTNYQR